MSSLVSKCTELHEDSETVLSDSWVAVQCSDVESLGSGSRCLPLSSNGELECLLEDKQEGSLHSMSKNSSKSNSLIYSPPQPQSPQTSDLASPHISSVNSSNELPALHTQLPGMLPKLSAEEKAAEWVWDWSSQPTTKLPKESQFRHPKRKGTPLSLRNTDAMKHDLLSWKFLQVFIPSLIVTNLFAFGLGFYFGKKLASAKNV